MEKKSGQRKAQIMGMPISVIFSIFLIVIFLVVAFFAIKHFLEIGKCSETGMFIEDLRSSIDEAWKSQSSSKTFTTSLPSGLEYVCFANLQEEANGNTREKEIYAELKKNADYTANMFFYPVKKACLSSSKIEHIEIKNNPYCFEVKDGKVEIKIEKGFFDDVVKVSRT